MVKIRICVGNALIYKVFAKILAKRLSPYTEQIIGDYQCGFRRDRSTMDQIFALRSILGKCYEYNITLHQLFIDFNPLKAKLNPNCKSQLAKFFCRVFKFCT